MLSRSFPASALAALLIAPACGEDHSDHPDTTTSDAASDSAKDAAAEATATTDAASDTASDAAPDTVADTPADTGAVKYTTCPPLADCIAAACLPVTKASCEADCIKQGSTDVAAKAAAYAACTDAKCVQGDCKGNATPKCLNDCIGKRCMGEAVACIDLGLAGTETCGGVMDCFGTCVTGKDDNQCLAKCYARMTKDGQKALVAVTQCVAKAPAGPDPFAACPAEMLTCLTSGQTGKDGCWTVFGCGDACKKKGGGETQCMSECLSKIDAAGQDQFGKLLPCLGNDKPGPDCAQKFTQCAQPSGNANCQQALACMNKCNAGKKGSGEEDPGPGCLFQCLHEAAKDAAPKLWAFVECSQNKDPKMADACADKIVQCLEPSGSDTCAQILGCAGACDGKPDKDNCVMGCFAKGSVKGLKEALAFANCQQACEQKCKPDDAKCKGDCSTTTCAAQYAVCFPK